VGRTKFRRWTVRLLFALLIGIPAALLAVHFINPFGVRSPDPRQRITAHGLYRVSSKSMLPGMIPGQVFITRAGAYAKEAPERHDVVTLLVEDEGTQVWTQRVMGLPGETISIEGGTVFVQGKHCANPMWLPKTMCRSTRCTWIRSRFRLDITSCWATTGITAWIAGFAASHHAMTSRAG
jgi:signal peptidase I